MTASPGDMAAAHWLSVRFRGEKVSARCLPSGELLVGPSGFVEFCYQPGGKAYKSRVDSFERIAGEKPSMRALAAEPAPQAAAAPARKTATGASTRASSPRGVGPSGEKTSRVVAAKGKGVRIVDLTARRGPQAAVQLWTDGACSGNPGPAGLGVLFEHAGQVREVAEYLGSATNNIAELTAVLRGLELVVDASVPVDVMTDSEYCIGLLGLGWKAKANQALVEELRAQFARFGDIQLVKVKGHAGVPGNERADELAREAIAARSNIRREGGAPVG